MTEILPSALPEMTEIWQATLNWQPTPEQQHKFQQLYELILAGNQRLNLTRITDSEEFWEKHLWDSLRGVACLFSQTSELKIIDIGTGAGFPGLPLAIAFPQYSITLLDSIHKKINFISSIAQVLNLNNVSPITGRSEEIGHLAHHRGVYNLALLRAVAPAPVCAEYALPFLQKDGLAILYRGHWETEEESALLETVKTLGGVIESIDAFQTPLTQSIRHCIHLRKVTKTPPEFPRPSGVALQKFKLKAEGRKKED